MSAADLFTAIDAGDDATVDALVSIDPALAAARDGDGVSATMHALYHGRAALAERLAAALPALDIFESAALGRPDRVQELVATDPGLAIARSADGFTALHFPAFFGLGDAVGASRLLLDAGADINARSANDLAVLPLHSAVAGNHDDVVALLIDAGADVNATQRHGYLPLHGAAQNGASTTVDRLIAAGADPTVANDDGRSPADLAAAAGYRDLADRLRGRGMPAHGPDAPG